MDEQNSPSSDIVEPAERFERFVSESIEMDKAWFNGTYDDWLDSKRKQEIEAFNAS